MDSGKWDFAYKMNFKKNASCQANMFADIFDEENKNKTPLPRFLKNEKRLHIIQFYPTFPVQRKSDAKKKGLERSWEENTSLIRRERKLQQPVLVILIYWFHWCLIHAATMNTKWISETQLSNLFLLHFDLK